MRTRRMRDLTLAALALALLPASALAHEGHGPEATVAGLAHWLSSPLHLVSVVVLVAAALGTVGFLLARRGRLLRRTSERRAA